MSDAFSELNDIEFVETLALKWNKSIIGIWTERHGKTRAHATGFYALYQGRIYLVTALHALKISNGSAVFITDFENIFQCNQMPWHSSIGGDLACIPCDLVSVNSDKTFRGYPIQLDIFDTPPSSYRGLMGFPCSKNKPTQLKSCPNVYCVGFDKIPACAITRTKIAKPLYYHFERERCISGNLQDIVAPFPRGMSGGPILARTDAGKVVLESVFIEYDAAEKIAIGSSRETLIDLLNTINAKYPVSVP